ncbi:hypothetical protein CAMGR0001_1404 [Campylobacter gracilis RM3268]|uniref:Uncharacterized protein n=1 Tax=Campylobacter gracilis RM3268 TaxID=553220 RepID=C8PJK4_9BACT|nr:hypothetical protein CAMGR0001_1404 [Campylobacter gracilis RM3268]
MYILRLKFYALFQSHEPLLWIKISKLILLFNKFYFNARS